MSRMRYRKRRRLIYGLIAVAVIITASFMIRVGLDADLYLQPSQIAGKGLTTGKHFRLGGMVKQDSYRKAEDGLTHIFTVTDCKLDKVVHFKGLIPSLFREGQGVIAEGALNGEDIFVATRVLAKHDENYEAKGTKPKGDAFKDGRCTHPGSYQS